MGQSKKPDQHERLLEAVRRYIQNQGEPQLEALDSVLRPLSDDSFERGRIYLSAREEVVNSLSTDDLDAIGKPDRRKEEVRLKAWAKKRKANDNGLAYLEELVAEGHVLTQLLDPRSNRATDRFTENLGPYVPHGEPIAPGIMREAVYEALRDIPSPPTARRQCWDCGELSCICATLAATGLLDLVRSVRSTYLGEGPQFTPDVWLYPRKALSDLRIGIGQRARSLRARFGDQSTPVDHTPGFERRREGPSTQGAEDQDRLQTDRRAATRLERGKDWGRRAREERADSDQSDTTLPTEDLLTFEVQDEEICADLESLVALKQQEGLPEEERIDRQRESDLLRNILMEFKKQEASPEECELLDALDEHVDPVRALEAVGDPGNWPRYQNLQRKLERRRRASS